MIVGGARTPFGTFGGALAGIPAVDLGACAIREALSRAHVPPEQVDYCFMGMVVQAGAGQIPSRQATIKAGLPVTVPSETVNKVCASGLRAVNLADCLIRSGEAEVVVAGGMESMSQAPYLLDRARWGAYRLGHGVLVDALIKDGLWCAFHDVHMGVHGSAVAREYGVTREEQDRWALRSHRRASKAAEEGRFAQEIVPVDVTERKGKTASTVRVDRDQAPRPDTTLEALAALKPAFSPEGTITAGNAPGLTDGAAALVIASEEKAGELGVRPLARIVGQATAAAEPPYIATVPALAADRVLARCGLSVGDLDLIEVNEAFAAVALTSMKIGEWPEERVNVNGGAIALGHPIGASGARILLTLAIELARRGGRFGLATVCAGAAQGEATLIEAWEV